MMAAANRAGHLHDVAGSLTRETPITLLTPETPITLLTPETPITVLAPETLINLLTPETRGTTAE
jgi:hypothetical protein